MSTLRILAGSVLALSLAASSWADPPKKSDPPEQESPSLKRKSDSTHLLLGKWVRTDKFVGTTMEYDKNGTYHTVGQFTPTQRSKNGMMGTWKLDGDRLVQTLGPYRTNTTVRIKTLTETDFVFINHAGQEVTYERVVEEKKKKR